MRIYKYWKIATTKIQFGYKEREISCYGGSNISEADASTNAKEKLEKVKRKINGDSNIFDNYEVEIREEVVRVLDEGSIITRNRYGAQVLNTENLMFLDIDKPRFSFWDFFSPSNSDNKTRIIKMIHKLVPKPIYREYGFRIYETNKGIRLIVLGKKFDPRDLATHAMMSQFNCDRLYMYLCKQQDCFRARLTPKPSRIKVREPLWAKFPRDNKAEVEFQKWLLEYEKASKNFSVCKFVEQLGANFYVRLPETEIIKIHDDITGATQNRQLA